VPSVALPGDDCTLTYELANIDPPDACAGLGWRIMDPPAVGSSENWFAAYVGGAWANYWFGGSPVANFGIKIFATGGAVVTTADTNCDGAVNAFDIDPFILALTDPAGYTAAYPNCNLLTADANCDGTVNAFDIDPFILCLTSGCTPCP